MQLKIIFNCIEPKMDSPKETEQINLIQRGESASQVERVCVRIESGQVKIRSELFHDQLGWYVSGSLQLPDHLLPLLEQALEQAKRERISSRMIGGKILPFREKCT